MIQKTILLLFITVLLGGLFQSVNAERVLSIDDVRKLALENNRQYLTAKEELTIADAEITTARAGGLPHINLNSYYTRNLSLPTVFLNPEGEDPISFKTGFKHDFGTSLSLKQSLWSGGRVINAYKVAKLYKKYANALVHQVEYNIVAAAEKLYHAAILTQSNYDVVLKAYEANSENLEVAQKLYDKGMISEYELLRAKVEKANLQPQLIQTESAVKLAQKDLKSFIGIPLDERIQLVDINSDVAVVENLKLDSLVAYAIENRPELKQAEYTTEMSRRAVSIMKADYYPKLEAVSSYNWNATSDQLSLSQNSTTSWSAGITVSIPIFKGGETRGNVKKYHAEYKQAEIDERDKRINLELEVEKAYDMLIEAKKSLDVQSETINQAEEGLRIANVRYESGVGTQLEVISAQSALTQARNSLAYAKYSFETAKSELKRVTTIEF